MKIKIAPIKINNVQYTGFWAWVAGLLVTFWVFLFIGGIFLVIGLAFSAPVWLPLLLLKLIL